MSNTKIAVVSPGGGGDNLLGLSLATYIHETDDIDTLALGAINPIRSYKEWLISRKFTEIVRQNCPNRKGLTKTEFKNYFKKHIKEINDGLVEIKAAPISNNFLKKLGPNYYNTLIPECDQKKYYPNTPFFGFSSTCCLSNKYYDFNGKPINEHSLIPNLHTMIQILRNFLIKNNITKLIIIDVGGDIINDIKDFDIFKMGRDALSLLVFLYIKDKYIPNLDIEINIYGIGVDGSDYPNNIIKSLKEFGFKEDNKASKLINETIENYYDNFLQEKLLNDKRATGILYNSMENNLNNVYKGLSKRRESKSKKIANDFYKTLGYISHDTIDERFYYQSELLFSKCFSLNTIENIKDIAIDLIPNTLLTLENNIFKLDKQIINNLSFSPDLYIIKKLCEQSNKAVNILNNGNLNSKLLSKFAGKEFAVNAKMLSDHPSNTLFGIKPTEELLFQKNINNGLFAIVLDRDCPLINASNGPNIVFLPNNLIINFFNNNIEKTKLLINKLIQYRNENKENLWKLYIEHIINSKTQIENISLNLYKLFEIIFKENISMADCGFDIVSFCQTWVKRDNEYVGDANFSIMTPHSQQKFYIKNLDKFIKFVNFNNIDYKCLLELYRINCKFKYKMKNYDGAFVNLDEVYKKLNKGFYTMYIEYYYQNYINYYYKKIIGYFNIYFNNIFNLVKTQFEY